MNTAKQTGPPSLLRLATAEGVSGAITIDVVGEIDIATLPALDTQFGQALRRRELSQVVVDLSGVGFCGVAGLQAFVDLDQRCNALGVDLELKPSRIVRRALDVTGLCSRFRLIGRWGANSQTTFAGRDRLSG
ncbi:STAS domain-containing protein [Amycolatopsis sp.]|uniref:STAS domain-containing protein n=1 Tax=Amycolatopsis sp. TaxID=37632 RepID=UPI002E03BFE7|nr:STAS domain-containing protein [Amycolatopsis sp.]